MERPRLRDLSLTINGMTDYGFIDIAGGDWERGKLWRTPLVHLFY